MGNVDWKGVGELLNILLIPKGTYRENMVQSSEESLVLFISVFKNYWKGINAESSLLTLLLKEKSMDLVDIAEAELLSRGSTDVEETS